MLCLGIESSCDETGLALIDEKGIRASVLSSQIDLHALFGGVVPELASREHAKLLPLLFDELLEKAQIKCEDIQGIAVANGPGLLGSLLVGVAFAKSLALALDIPIVGVNHLHSHLSAVGLEYNTEFPALGILVSGGHTHLYEIKNFHEYKLLGKTLDDAAGEACDKFAKMLALPYPGGALLDMLGQQGELTKENKRIFPRPYTKNDNLDFSFSGLKTAAAQFLKVNPHLVLEALPKDAIASPQIHKERIKNAPQELSNAAAAYLYAIADTLAIKAKRSLEHFENPPKSLILAGGVAANSFVRERFSLFCKEEGLEFLYPSMKLCTDNAEMIAYLGRTMLCHGKSSGLDFPAYPRGSVLFN